MTRESYEFDAVPGKVLFETDLYSPASLQKWLELAKSFRNELEFVLSTDDEAVSLVLEKDPNVKNLREADNVPCVITSMTSSKTNTMMDSEKMRNIAYNHVAEIFANPLVHLECIDGIEGMFAREGCTLLTEPTSPEKFLIGLVEPLARYLREETSNQKRHFSSEIWRPNQITKFLSILGQYPEGFIGIDLETHTGTSDQRTLSFSMDNIMGATREKTPKIVGVKYPSFGRMSKNGTDPFSKAYNSFSSLFARRNTRETPMVIRGYSHVEDRPDIDDFHSLQCPLIPEHKLELREFLMEAERRSDEVKRHLLKGKLRK